MPTAGDDRPAAESDALRVAAENIPGVRDVKLHFVSVPPIAAF
jgi:hypothetical protein